MCCSPYRNATDISNELTYNELKALIGGMEYLIDVVKDDIDIKWNNDEELKEWVEFRQNIIKKLKKKVGE